MLAEHAWEHLTYEEGILAAINWYKYLKPGVYIRCAVPDINFRNDWYQMLKINLRYITRRKNNGSTQY